MVGSWVGGWQTQQRTLINCGRGGVSLPNPGSGRVYGHMGGNTAFACLRKPPRPLGCSPLAPWSSLGSLVLTFLFFSF